MSYIDTIEHELVGYLNGLPIYHPLEVVETEKWGAYDFSCSPKNLVIGGGAGEHPGLVIHNLGYLVVGFMLEAFNKINEIKEEKKYHCDFVLPAEETINSLHDILFAQEGDCMEFCGWSMHHFKEFIESAKSPLHATPLLKEADAEEWIKDSIGEFVFYSLPELNPLHDKIISLPDMNGLEIGYWMSNVTCPPPNYIKSKRKSLQSSHFRRHGFFRWDFNYPPKEE